MSNEPQKPSKEEVIKEAKKIFPDKEPEDFAGREGFIEGYNLASSQYESELARLKEDNERLKEENEELTKGIVDKMIPILEDMYPDRIKYLESRIKELEAYSNRIPEWLEDKYSE